MLAVILERTTPCICTRMGDRLRVDSVDCTSSSDTKVFHCQAYVDSTQGARDQNIWDDLGPADVQNTLR